MLLSRTEYVPFSEHGGSRRVSACRGRRVRIGRTVPTSAYPGCRQRREGPRVLGGPAGSGTDRLRAFVADPSTRFSAAGLAGDAGCTKRNIADALEALGMTGLLEVERRRNRILSRLVDATKLVCLTGDMPSSFPRSSPVFRILMSLLTATREVAPSKPMALAIEVSDVLHDLEADCSAVGAQPPAVDTGRHDLWGELSRFALELAQAWSSGSFGAERVAADRAGSHATLSSQETCARIAAPGQGEHDQAHDSATAGGAVPGAPQHPRLALATARRATPGAARWPRAATRSRCTPPTSPARRRRRHAASMDEGAGVMPVNRSPESQNQTAAAFRMHQAHTRVCVAAHDADEARKPR